MDSGNTLYFHLWKSKIKHVKLTIVDTQLYKNSMFQIFEM